MNRYARQIQLPEVGAEGQAALSIAHVVVIGAGGLAASALPLLAAAGIGQITILDPDTVEQSNLHRQTLFTETDVGQPKATGAAARCQAINSDITVIGKPMALTPLNVTDTIIDATLVLDCADTYAVSYTLSDACHPRGIPLITASALGFSGYVAGTCGTAPSLRALFADAPASGATCATAGVMGPIVTTLGALQAQMALNTILGLSPSSLGQILNLDGQTFRTSGFRFDAAPEPNTRFRFAHPEQLTDQDTIIELRDKNEAPTPAHPNAKRITTNTLNTLSPNNTRLALCCATGWRSWRAAEHLKPIWPGEIVLVAAATT